MSTVFNDSVVFTFEAWTKLTYMCAKADTEIGGFGISHADDPFTITDFVLVPQECTAASVDFDDDGLADHMDNMMDKGIIPARCFRHWIHTHPGNSASPSGTDWTSWTKCFPDANWSSMIILAKGGDTSAHVRNRVAVGEATTVVTSKLEVEYYDVPDGPCLIDPSKWDKELKDNVRKAPPPVVVKHKGYPKTYYGGYYAQQVAEMYSDVLDTDELKAEADANNLDFRKGKLK